MWRVNLPNKDNALEELELALTYKSGEAKYTLTAEEKTIIQEIYNKYEALKGAQNNVLKGPTLSKETKNAIHDAYSEVQKSRRLSGLRDRLLLNINRCPVCGILPADTLDHHLPKSEFKPLGVYSSNLVPMCEKCNNKKRTVDGTGNTKAFIHFYYEELPLNEQFFIANAEMKDGALIVTYKIDKTPNLTDPQYDSIKYQLERIGFKERIIKDQTIFLLNHAVGLKKSYGKEKNVKRVKEYLLECAEVFITDSGLNDWRTALLIGLSKCDDYCDGGFL